MMNRCCHSGRLDKDDLSTKLGQLAHKIEEVKVDVHDALVKKYAEFYPLFDATVQLRARVSDLHHDVDGSLSVIEKQVPPHSCFVLVIMLQCCAQSNTPAVWYWLHPVLDDGRCRD